MSENRKRPTIERDVMNRKNKPMMRVRDLCDVESAYRPALEIEQRETALARQLGDPCFAIGSGAKIGRSDLNVFRRRKNLLPWLAIFRWIDCPKHFVAIDERKERPAKRVEIERAVQVELEHEIVDGPRAFAVEEPERVLRRRKRRMLGARRR
jgi:hypothetical protein